MRQWSFFADMNHDGVVTISDVWHWFKWLYFYPGDLALQGMLSYLPGFSTFFEVTGESFGGWGSGIFSFLCGLFCSRSLVSCKSTLRSAAPHPNYREVGNLHEPQQATTNGFLHMTPLRLSKRMKEALERLYETTEQSDWVNMYTAQALENRRLITVARTRSRSAGGQFPDSWASLSGNGRKWCERHFAKARGRTQ